MFRSRYGSELPTAGGVQALRNGLIAVAREPQGRAATRAGRSEGRAMDRKQSIATINAVHREIELAMFEGSDMTAIRLHLTAIRLHARLALGRVFRGG